jgi:hypothetical protein
MKGCVHDGRSTISCSRVVASEADASVVGAAFRSCLVDRSVSLC